MGSGPELLVALLSLDVLALHLNCVSETTSTSCAIVASLVRPILRPFLSSPVRDFGRLAAEHLLSRHCGPLLSRGLLNSSGRNVSGFVARF